MYVQSDSQITDSTLHSMMYAKSVAPFAKIYSDEISLVGGDEVRVLGIDTSKTMIRVAKGEVIGWISRMSLEDNDLEKAIRQRLKDTCEEPWKRSEIPQRVEQLYRQRRIAHMLEKIKGIKPEHQKIAKIISDRTKQFYTKCATTIAPHQSKIIQICPDGKAAKFYMVEPNSKYYEHDSIELLDGSYYESHGGYMVVRNTTEKALQLSKGTYVGDGYEIELEDLPFMDPATRSLLTMTDAGPSETKKEDTVKEKSRKAFGKKIENFDPDLKRVLSKYTEMFLDQNPMEFETLNIRDLELPERDDIPDHLPPPHRRHYSLEDEEAIAVYLEAGLLSGFLKPIESEYTSPLLVVKRPGSDKKRCCLDARLINEKLLKPISYPMPTPTEIIRKMAKNEIYTTLDAKSAFNQIKLSERSQKLVAFSVFLNGRRGTYTTTSMPFGIRCAPQAYQQTIDGVIHKFKRPFSDADSYIDDLNLGSRSDGIRSAREIHLEDLDRLLSRLWEVGVRLNIDKCEFLKLMVIYCGQEVSKGTYRPSEKHREAIRNLKSFSVKDNSKNALGRYLGILGYHRRFGGKDYAFLEKSMRKAVEDYRKKKITANQADEKIKELSDKLKDEILKTKLIVPDGTEKLYLNTDASKFSWGAVLTIKDKGVISYHGGTFGQQVIDNWTIFSKEIAGLLKGLEYNQEFIVTAPEVEVSVDNMATVLSSTTTKPHTKSTDIVNIMRIQQLLGMCQGKITVKHCSGNSNLLADFLSRLIYHEEDKPAAHMAVLQDSKAPVVPSKDRDILYIPSVGVVSIYNDREEEEKYIKLKTEHESHHYSFNRTLNMLKEREREPNRKLVKRVIAECPVCCSIPRKIAPYSKISLKPTPYKPLMELSTDFIIAEKESSQGHKYLLTARCEFSKYVVAIPAKTKGIMNVVEIFDNIFNTLGARPELIAMDNEFNTEQVRQWAKRRDIKVHFRCVKNYRSIGVERVHQDIHDQFTKMMHGKNPRSWHTRIGDIVDPLNKAVHSVTGVSPYKVIFGVPACRINNVKIEDKSSEARKREQLYKMIRSRIITSKSTYSKDHTWPPLEAGEPVIVKYTNSKYEKERHGTVQDSSGPQNPRAEIYFPDNPPKYKTLGIHKGHIYKRIEPLPPLYGADSKTNVDSQEGEPLADILTPPQTSAEETDIFTPCSDTAPEQSEISPQIDPGEEIAPEGEEKPEDPVFVPEPVIRKTRTRRAPERLGF